MGLSEVEARVLRRLGVTRSMFAAAETRARSFHLDLVSVFIANGVLDADDWWSALARELGLAHERDIPPALVAPPVVAGRLSVPDPRAAMIPGAVVDGGGAPRQALAPRGPAVDALRDLLARHPELIARIVIASPEAIAASVRAAVARDVATHAVEGLNARTPHLSAKGAPTRRQMLVLGGGLALALLAFHMAPALFVLLLCVPTSFAFFAMSGLRVLAGLMPDRPPPALLRHGRAPRYLVLVPVHREAAVIPDLVKALAGLRYPRERLTIALIAEADDTSTLDAIKAVRLPAHFRLVVVPEGAPRTKPRALQYAVSLFACDLVTVYDAEDRPHACQLIEAAQAFACGSPRLGCLQAPLVIDTVGAGSTWISRQFAVEYDALFRRVLPVMARLGMPIPLGGTSMHLKRAVLDAVGGWDPHNVTEDADLGMRLARYGYRTQCLALPTYEEAPLDASAWIKQRSRWLKGWMQTWFVHMRAPLDLWRQAGPAGFMMLNLFVIGSVVAAFAYPLSLGILVLGLVGLAPVFADRTVWGDVWLIAFLMAFFSGLGASLWLTAVSAMRSRAMGLGELKWTLVYWALLLPAFLRAAWEMIVAPHHWEKTEHGRAKRPAPRLEHDSCRPPRPGLRIQVNASLGSGC